MTVIVGIDPGLSGALAVLRGNDLLAVEDLLAEAKGGSGTVKRRLCATHLARLLRDLRAEHSRELLAVVEQVSAGRGQGVSSVFSLGDTAGCIRGVAQALGLRVEWVTPAQWKRAMRVPADKGVARTIACARWPERAAWFARALDHNRAEAALIAAYGWEQFG